MESKTFVGGLRAELWNWTFPFAALCASRDQLIITVLGEKKYIFTPDQVVGIKKRFGGIQIFHNIASYPTLIIFWYFNPSKVLKAIESIGFTPLAAGDMDDSEYQTQRQFAVVFILLIFVPIIIVAALDAIGWIR
ncbi:MAG TPA: hypothetical protein VE439_09750 [Anaerolineae bacterium]|jgi:hypothetical protein|nr:hypothetical protein [Anaerolineae bacterium]